MAPTTTITNLSATTLPGHTGAPTPSTFTDTKQSAATVAAILTAAHTTITAYQVESTTGLAVVDGTTLTWRHNKGITLANGDVVSLGFNGLEDKTTTAAYEAIPLTTSASEHSSTTITRTKASTTETLTKAVHHHHTSAGTTNGHNTSGGSTSGGSATTNKPSVTTGAKSSSSSGVAPTMGAGKALALLGAVGGVVALGL